MKKKTEFPALRKSQKGDSSHEIQVLFLASCIQSPEPQDQPWVVIEKRTVFDER